MHANNAPGTLSKKFRLVQCLSVLTLVALTAAQSQANDVSNIINVTGGTTFFGALHTDNLDFTDTFTFSVVGPFKANASLITVGSGPSNIDFISADLNGVALTLNSQSGGFFETGFLPDTNLTGPLVLKVRGRSGAAGGISSSYSGTVNVMAVVPEPHSCALLLAGLGMLGWKARRRASM